ncbi:HPP family protein (plasmid) [Stanieria cyanosphaera PCC 7437]|uniref:HPP family protein n=1 Tax=Stanieria cyanosphaera (strain ATCC 29371 / PCC 7437) TaxID=111780 RepID=K9Y185_STAC7|nr:HPP family protein [Stanieria cyanosphaera]AFZ38151.1 HPP family protein [Stanieria cyanosphaera PCC 7437]
MLLKNNTVRQKSYRKNTNQSALRRWKRKFYILQQSRRHQPKFSWQHILLSYVGSFIGIAVLAYLSVYSSYPLIAAPFGATAVLVFGVPDSPLAQPRNVIGGNLIAALTCVILVHLFGTGPWVMALAVATTIKLMQLTRTVHPPSGAVALIGVLSNVDWRFIFTPALGGSIIIVLVTVIFNNLVEGRPYPRHWL